MLVQSVSTGIEEKVDTVGLGALVVVGIPTFAIRVLNWAGVMTIIGAVGGPGGGERPGVVRLAVDPAVVVAPWDGETGGVFPDMVFVWRWLLSLS